MFKPLECKQSSDTVHLTGQLKRGAYSCKLPVMAGRNLFTIKMLVGELRLNHSSFNPDGGAYTAPPGGRLRQYYDLYEGNTYHLSFHVGEHFGRKDRIEVINPHMLNGAAFEYTHIRQ